MMIPILSLNARVTKENDIVVLQGKEFPNVIVQGNNLQDATVNFLKALEFYFVALAERHSKDKPLLKNEKIVTLKMEVTPV